MFSPHCSDPNAGALSNPFHTLKRARDEIHRVRSKGRGFQSPVTVYLRGVDYFNEVPFVLMCEDGGTTEYPVTQARYRDERPVNSGGKVLTGWREQLVDGKRAWTIRMQASLRGSGLPKSLWVHGQQRNSDSLRRSCAMNIDTLALRGQIHEYIEGQKRDAWARITTPMEKSVGEVTRIAEQWQTEESKLLGELEKVERTVSGILKRIGK